MAAEHKKTARRRSLCTALMIDWAASPNRQTAWLRRRRAKITRPPRAIMRPGNPAPTIGPGTAAVVRLPNA